ncbi:hypothetical protein OUZ56_028197 [Daphnia magna]|uniref:non-specific serine/threonine protein kinase n=1 Tax=Daphnia magna TaxID=35525 RepID=A0ABR0B357_9CRUS|nr:hypothetical protein OUZ56_028197 [Daphnia magna]
MSRSPCVAASLKSLLPITDFKSPNHLKLSPAQPVQTQYRTSLSPYPQCNPQPTPLLSPSPSHFNFPSPNNFFQQRDCISVDSPQRLLFSTKIKTTLNSSNILGRGRFGQVVLAKYKDAQVAVKIIKNAAKEQIFETNGEKLSHPNIVSTLKIERLDDDVLILMEPWGSLNLQQFLSLSLKIPWEDVLSYSRQLAMALDYCHANGVLHLDVKPANVMVNGEKWIKLGDFGNSASVQHLEYFQYQQRVGTVSYCSPELLQGDIPSTKSDVYSYGITLWQFQHNQIPFSDLDWPTVAYLVVAKDERPSLTVTAIDEDEQIFVKLYQNCWQPKPENRPSMLEIVNLLKNMGE